MLSISNVAPEQGADYFKEDNYYFKSESFEQSKCFGNGAAALGLSGQVEGEPFKNLLHGQSPQSEQSGRG